MTSFVAIAVLAIAAVCISPTTSVPLPQVVTTPPLPPQGQGSTEGLGEQIGKFVDQMVQRGKDVLKEKFSRPQGAQGAALQGPPQGPPPHGPPPQGALHQLAAGFVGGAETAHGKQGQLHGAACRNATG